MGCCKWMKYTAALLAAFLGYNIYFLLCSVPEIPNFPADQWWGPGSSKAVDTAISPMKITFKSEMVLDLKERLNKARFYTAPLENIGFQYGFNNDYLKEVVEFWKNEYNFNEREAYLNKYPHFQTSIQGLNIHFIRVKPELKDKSVKVYPMLLLHGWPGSVLEFYKAIPFLMTTKKEANFVFELIIPSLPGYGFSQGAAKPGMGVAQVAVIMNNLMTRLGYKKYIVQGGDWGSMVANHLSLLYPDSIIGHHTNMPVNDSPLSTAMMILGSIMPSLVIDKAHESKMYPLSDMFSFLLEESGYFHIQATKPDTVGVGLSDSPVGLAAYIIEKFSAWTDPKWKTLKDGGITKKFTLTELLDNIMVYWSTQTITTSVRLYSETINKSQMSLYMDRIPVHVPTAVARCLNEISFVMDCQLKDKYKRLIQISNHENCGHFFAFEEPKAFAEDVWSAALKFIEYHSVKNEKSEL